MYNKIAGPPYAGKTTNKGGFAIGTMKDLYYTSILLAYVDWVRYAMRKCPSNRYVFNTEVEE